MANASIWAQPQGAPPPPMDTSGMDQTPLAKFAATASDPGSQVFAPTPAPAVKLAPQPPSPEQSQISNDQQRLAKIRWEQENPWGTPENHPGKLGKIAHAFSTLGNIAGDIFAPSTMALIPGTQMNRQMQEGGLAKRLNSEITDESQNAYRGAEQAKDEEATREMPAEAANKEGLESVDTQAKQQELNEGPTMARSLDYYVNKALKESRDPQEDPNVQHLQDAIQNMRAQAASKGKEHVNLQDAKHQPFGGTFDPGTGKYYDASGNVITNPVPYEKPQVTNNHFEEHEGDKGRALLDKAEGQYRTAEQGAQGIRGMIDDALQGGKISARMLPLEGALEVTTANGVKRINRTEVDQYAGGGSLFDRLAGQIGGATKGIPFTPEIMNDMKRLADVQEKGAYDNYKGGYDSATRRYHLTDEQALPAPSGSAGGGQTFTDGGVTYHIPLDKVNDFKKDHPNAR